VNRQRSPDDHAGNDAEFSESATHRAVSGPV